MEEETTKCAAKLDSLQVAYTWALVILIPTVLFLFGVVIFHSFAQASLQRRHDRLLVENRRRDRGRVVTLQQWQNCRSLDLPPTYREAAAAQLLFVSQQRREAEQNSQNQVVVNCTVLPVPESAEQRRLQLRQLLSLGTLRFAVQLPKKNAAAVTPRGSVRAV